uniref:Uncharacterized protein n=1 Tax=viral metagenome TaxID=1070528 RepID=A0A6H1Z623_9ZZZZ
MTYVEAMELKVGDRISIITKDFFGEGIVRINDISKGKNKLVAENNTYDGYIIISPYFITRKIE